MKKMDEMEMSISLKSIKNAWFYTVLFLFVWSMYELIKHRKTGLPHFLLITQNLVWLGTTVFLKWKMNKNEE